jgi:hypothetical protein
MNDTHKPGPNTEAGKAISSQNALKHGLFSTKSFLIQGESEEAFDRHFYRYTKEHNPKTATEEDLVLHLAQVQWRRLRIPALEADAIQHAVETGEHNHKFLHIYALYDQRLNRDIQNTLKDLKELQAARKKQTAIHFRMAMLLYNHFRVKNDIPYNLTDDGFVFSSADVASRLNTFNRLRESNHQAIGFATDDEIDAFIAHPIM